MSLMSHSPHTSFSSSFAKRVLAYLLLLAALVFGALNAAGAFASPSNIAAHKRLDAQKKMIISDQEVIVDVPQTTPELVETTKPKSQVNVNNYVKTNSTHLDTIHASRIYSSSNDMPLTGAGIVVGIVDSGLNVNQDTFRDQNGNSRIVAQSCFGFVSDIAPCDSNNPANLECSLAQIGCFHGNAVADLAVGSRFSETLQDGQQIATGGVAPSASISFARITLNAKGELDESLLIAALNKFLLDVQSNSSIAPDVINISIGFSRDGKFQNCNAPSEIKTLIDKLVSNNVSVIASSGNSGFKDNIMFPACLDNVISVGATNLLKNSEEVSSFTQTSSELDLVAPGSNLMASRPLTGNYSAVKGTSFATPLVTGSVALLKQLNPNLTPSRIKEILINNGDLVNDNATGASFSRINILRSVQSIDPSARRFADPNL